MRACSFCGTLPHDDAATKCRQCGAPLPVANEERRKLPPGALERVPPAPRRATLTQVSGASGFLTVWGALFGGIGGGMGLLFLVFGLVASNPVLAIIGGLFALVFGGVGGTALVMGLRGASAELRNIRTGVPVEATLASVGVDASTSHNGQRPVRVTYTFPWEGEERAGASTTFDARARRFEEGDAVIVLVDPASPERQSLYLK